MDRISMSELPKWLQDMVVEAKLWGKWPPDRSIDIADIALHETFSSDVIGNNKAHLVQLLIDEVEQLRGVILRNCDPGDAIVDDGKIISSIIGDVE